MEYLCHILLRVRLGIMPASSPLLPSLFCLPQTASRAWRRPPKPHRSTRPRRYTSTTMPMARSDRSRRRSSSQTMRRQKASRTRLRSPTLTQSRPSPLTLTRASSPGRPTARRCSTRAPLTYSRHWRCTSPIRSTAPLSPPASLPERADTFPCATTLRTPRGTAASSTAR